MFAAKLSSTVQGWRGVCLVAITYVYFLIFAQFAFLNRLAQLGVADAHLQAVMAAMAIGGITFSLVASRRAFESRPRLWLKTALLVCGIAAALTLLPLSLPASIALSFLIGSGLGMLTVTLVSNLRLWIGTHAALLKVGLGTGIGYFICNIPGLFTATPGSQGLAAAGLCLLGIYAAGEPSSPDAFLARTDHGKEPAAGKQLPFRAVLVAFTALVWLDSAAFFIIQNTPSLKAGTWQGSLHLCANGGIHFLAAMASAFLLRRRGLSFVLCAAVVALSLACLLLHLPTEVVLASIFYPVGVSFYSVALVAYPSLIASSASPHQRARRAALIYAVAGWFGSAMGIGMGQHLRYVPIPFVGLAASLILGTGSFFFLRRHKLEIASVSVVLVVALGIRMAVAVASPRQAPPSAQARGRQVYLAEGCISCHSQYVRPGTEDGVLWGPAETLSEIRAQRPPLIGNRRQGPDLSQVGGRRSPLWLKAHFYNPRAVSHASFMPSYQYLFKASTRGDDLVQYIGTLKSPRYADHFAKEQAWHPAEIDRSTISPQAGLRLYGAYCATCHESSGATQSTWRSRFPRLPPDLKTGPWLYLPASDNNQERLRRLQRIVKFGLPGTNMPGHEYLSDLDVVSLALWLDKSPMPPQQSANTVSHPGESQ